MRHPSGKYWFGTLLLTIITLILGLKVLPAKGQQSLYNPIPLTSNNQIMDTLSEKDIPTGEGGFARDYLVELEEGDQVAIDLISEEFDSVLLLLAADGSTMAENDDGPDGSTNSLLFARITETGKYIIRVRAFGETGGGKFSLKLNRLRPVR
ncbi:MAG TPA: peptidase [Cyanothece sp. UBA12306]|nr:peptidase [Cyanothece sp. UBA12306]